MLEEKAHEELARTHLSLGAVRLLAEQIVSSAERAAGGSTERLPRLLAAISGDAGALLRAIVLEGVRTSRTSCADALAPSP